MPHIHISGIRHPHDVQPQDPATRIFLTLPQSHESVASRLIHVDFRTSQVCWDLAEVRRPGGVFGLRGALETPASDSGGLLETPAAHRG